MSMPSFPKNGADMTREEALTMIIACLAMEELALSHILNAGGEHLQFVLGTLPGTSSKDVLAVHKSITGLVEAVTQNQLLLKKKLDQVLEFCPRPSEPDPVPKPDPDPTPPAYPVEPSPKPPSYPSYPTYPSYPVRPGFPSYPPHYNVPWPPHHPGHPGHPGHHVPLCKKSALHLMGQREKMLWEPDCRLSWRHRGCSGRDICWDGHTPGRIQLNPGKTYVVQYTLNVCAASPAEGMGRIFLRQSPCGAFADVPPRSFSLENLHQAPQTLQHVSVLHPRTSSGYPVELSLVLNAKIPLCVNRAVLDIAEL